jgi:hypothetical protein
MAVDDKGQEIGAPGWQKRRGGRNAKLRRVQQRLVVELRMCWGIQWGYQKINLGLAKNDGYERASKVGVSTGCRWRWCRINNPPVLDLLVLLPKRRRFKMCLPRPEDGVHNPACSDNLNPSI